MLLVVEVIRACLRVSGVSACKGAGNPARVFRRVLSFLSFVSFLVLCLALMADMETLGASRTGAVGHETSSFMVAAPVVDDGDDTAQLTPPRSSSTSAATSWPCHRLTVHAVITFIDRTTVEIRHDDENKLVKCSSGELAVKLRDLNPVTSASDLATEASAATRAAWK